MISQVRYLTFVLTLSVLVIYYLSVSTFQTGERGAVYEAGDMTIKEIVAYSLKKQIEIESEEISCENLRHDVNFTSTVKLMWTAVPNTKLFVHSVHLDERLNPHKYLRIIGMYKGKWDGTVYCQTFGEDGKYYVTKSRKTDIWMEQWHEGEDNTYSPVLVSCLIPKRANRRRVSLNGRPCDINKPFFTISGRQRYSRGKSKNQRVAVCVKPLNFKPDISEHLVQWIEINKILGANKIDIYVENVHENVRRVLKWYEETQNVNLLEHQSVGEYFRGKEREELADINFNDSSNKTIGNKNLNTERSNDISPLLNASKMYAQSLEEVVTDVTVNESEETARKIWQKRRNELISYNDCFYRNLDTVNYVLPVDIDEIIVPKRFNSWGRLLDELAHLRDYASLSVRNAYFLRQYASKTGDERVFFFKYLTRADYSAKEESGKSFVSTRNALTIFNHYALHVLRPGVGKIYFLAPDAVQMNHYRNSCSVSLLPECAKYLYNARTFSDATITKYRKEFDVKYNETGAQLKKI